MKNVIVVTQRFRDFHVCIENMEGIWSAGKTVDEALGDLIRHHQEFFNVEVKLDTSVKKFCFD